MKILLRLCVPVLLAAAALAQGQTPEQPSQPAAPLFLLQLADGSTLWGELVEHDPGSLLFRRLDNGGEVRLPWSLLAEDQSNAMRETFGYIDHSDEELMIEADRLVLDDGREVVGKIVNRTDAAILVKTATTVVAVPKARIRAAAGTVQVPVLEVYTREELYQQALSELVADSASSQFELGRYCERILDFAHALAHYQKAAELDANYKAADVQGAITRARKRAEQQAQIDYLYKIDLLRARKQFDEADKLAQAFDQLFPQSGLRAEVDKRKKQIEKSRDRELRSLVVSMVHFWTGRMLDMASRDPNMTLEASIDYVSDKLSEDVFNAVAIELGRRVTQGVDATAVKKMWSERKNAPSYKASYGSATWLLGDEARKGLEKSQETTDAAASEKNAERQQLEEKIKRYLQNQAIAQKAKAGTDEGEDRGKYWAALSAILRKQWLLAYHAEHSKDFIVLNVLFSSCPDCGGTGVRELGSVGDPRSNPNTGGRGAAPKNTATIQLVNCPTCHHTGIQRRVVYR